MYDGYDQVRRMMAGYRSIYDQMDSAVRAASLVSKEMARQFADRAEFLRLTTPSDSYARNLFDQLRLERGILADSLRSTYRRPEALARVDEMLAGIQREATSFQYQLPSGLTESFAESQRLLKTSTLSTNAFNDSYSQLKALQRSMAAQSADLASRLDELRPLLSAQSNWARTVALPSSIEAAHSFADEATALFKQISALYSNWEPLADDFDEEAREHTEQAIALANERLAAAFAEKSPTATLSKIKELLTHLKSGTLRLAPQAKTILLALLIEFICSFIVDYSKDVRAPEAPRVCKEARREVRKLQREELGPLSSDLQVVIANALIVRRGPGQSTPAVGRLFAGDLVFRIKERTRSWSLVEFQDEEGDVVLRGWVFSRYLKPLSGCAHHPCRR